MKKNIKNKMQDLDIEATPKINTLFQYIYDYEPMTIKQSDIVKRKRTKNIVPLFERCTAQRASGTQCTRRRKNDKLLCGTHLKGTPHGIVKLNKNIKQTKQIFVWVEDIKGIIYHIDNDHNVYDNQDIRHNIPNPKIIAKWMKNDNDEYIIPEFL